MIIPPPVIKFAVVSAAMALSVLLSYQHGVSVEKRKRDEADKISQLSAKAQRLNQEVIWAGQLADAEAKGQAGIAAARADAAGARSSFERLHGEVERIISARLSGDPAATAVSASATSSTRMLAELFRRADERAGVLAETADEARSRGLTCERAYEALRASNKKAAR